MKTKYFIYLSLLLGAITLGCVSCSKEPVDDFEEVQDYEVKSLQLSSKSSELVKLTNSFAYDFIDRINAEAEGSYVVSPLSLQFLLGLVLNGAVGSTADEICNVLGYGAGEIDDVNEFCLSMLQQLPSLDARTKVCIANALFVNQKYPVKAGYKSVVEKNYEAQVTNLDFSNTTGSADVINKWCNDNTKGLIPQIIDRVDPAGLAYLLNALYFKGAWMYAFKSGNTTSETFTKENGKKVKVKMMKQDEELAYSENELFQSVSLPFGKGSFRMNLYLPVKGKTVSDVTNALRTSGLNAFPGRTNAKVDLMLPKFETSSDMILNDVLKAMGMRTAFSNYADFSAMTDAGAFLSIIKQKAKITVNEEGAEAAAVTVGFMLTSAPKNVSFYADRPFLYTITESTTGVVLFAGKYDGD
jgi:serpin B